MGSCVGHHSVIGGCAKDNRCIRMLPQETLQALESAVGGDIVGIHLTGKGLGGQYQYRAAVGGPVGLFHLLQETEILLFLRKGFKFLVRVQIGLADDHLQRLAGCVKPAAGRPDHGPEKGQGRARQGGDAGLGIPAGHPAVGQGYHQAEKGQVGRPHPQRTTQGAQHRIPLHQGGGIGKSIAQHQPWPGDFGRGEVKTLPGYPGGGQVQVRHGTAAAALHPAEAAQYQRHLQGVGQDGEDGPAHRSFSHPPGGDGVPQHKSSVMPPPEVPDFVFGGQALHDQKRQQAHQGGPAHVRHQPGQAHEQGKGQGQDDEGAFFHRDAV